MLRIRWKNLEKSAKIEDKKLDKIDKEVFVKKWIKLTKILVSVTTKIRTCFKNK